MVSKARRQLLLGAGLAPLTAVMTRAGAQQVPARLPIQLDYTPNFDDPLIYEFLDNQKRSDLRDMQLKQLL